MTRTPKVFCITFGVDITIEGIFERYLAEFQEVACDELFQEGQLWVL